VDQLCRRIAANIAELPELLRKPWQRRRPASTYKIARPISQTRPAKATKGTLQRTGAGRREVRKHCQNDQDDRDGRCRPIKDIT
jgi:hypothetical protein